MKNMRMNLVTRKMMRIYILLIACMLLVPSNCFATTDLNENDSEDQLQEKSITVHNESDSEIIDVDASSDYEPTNEEYTFIDEPINTSNETKAAQKSSWTNLIKKTVKGKDNFKKAWGKTANPSHSTVNYGYSSTAGIKTYYTDTWSRYKHRSITKCCNSNGVVKKSKVSAAQMAYHWRAADILTTTKYTYVIYQAQRTGSLQ